MCRLFAVALCHFARARPRQKDVFTSQFLACNWGTAFSSMRSELSEKRVNWLVVHALITRVGDTQLFLCAMTVLLDAVVECVRPHDWVGRSVPHSVGQTTCVLTVGSSRLCVATVGHQVLFSTAHWQLGVRSCF